MAAEVDICNRALQKLGAKRITSLSQDAVNARACSVAYEPRRNAMLRAHPWNFSIKRAELAADSTTPAWGRANSFTLPADFLCLRDDYPEDNVLSKDWQIEGKKIITDDSDPIYIRYTYIVTDPNEMDALFIEALATDIAHEICEEITQSISKKEGLRADLKVILADAKSCNAIENVAQQPPQDDWLTCRS